MIDDIDRAILDIETRHWHYAGAKTRHIRDTLGLGETAYYQRLARLLDDADAWAYAPAVVKRLRGARSARRIRD